MTLDLIELDLPESPAADLVALARTPYSTVMLAKTESVDDVNALGDRPVIALCETARGVLNAANIASVPSAKC